MSYNIYDLEEYLLEFAGGVEAPFLYEDIIKTVCDEFDIKKDARLEEDIKAILSSDGGMLLDDNSQRYIPKNSFYSGKKFCVTPTLTEIKDGILFPGHRLAVFCCEELFPSEMKIHMKDCKNFTKSREYDCSIEDAAFFHSLLGVEDMFHHFIADNHSNGDVLSEGNAELNISLTVFDLKEFYKENSFKVGDLIVFTIEDWASGILSYSYLAAEKRERSKQAKWIELFDKALLDVVERLGSYIEITQQIQEAFIVSPGLLVSPNCSFDEYLDQTDRIEIKILGGRTVLGKVEGASEDEQYELEIPEGISISQGDIDSLSGILKELGCPLKDIEIDAFMRDEIEKGNDSLESVYERCIHPWKLNFKDDAQQVVFHNYIEDMWEQLHSFFKKSEDSDKSYLRSQIIHALDERIQWMVYLGEMELDTADFPEEKMQKLVQINNHMTELLRLINSESEIESEEELSELLESIEELTEIQLVIMEDINDAVC